MNFIEALQSFFENYFNFNGRASRSEYWYSYLGFFLLIIITALVSIFIFRLEENILDIVIILIRLIFFIPFISCGVRRMHDTGHSGWYILIPIYSFILMVSAGDPDENFYGEEPF
mgnify:CR=1 FL=1